MQFTLPKLFLVVSLAALACAGMFSPTFGLTSAIVSVTIGVFALAAIRAIKFQGRDRAFAIVFAFAGAIYLLLVTNNMTRYLARNFVTNYPIAAFAVAQDRASMFSFTAYPVSTSPYLPATPPAGTPYYAAPSNSAPASTPPAPATSAPMPPPSTSIPQTWTVTPATVQTPSDTQWEAIIGAGFSDDDDKWPLCRTFLIGHCIWSWLIALLAAWFAGRMYAKRTTPGSHA